MLEDIERVDNVAVAHKLLSAVYLVVSRFLLPPSMVGDEIRDGRLLEVLNNAVEGLEEYAPYCGELASHLRALSLQLEKLASDQSLLDNYSAEYTRILMTSYKHVPCPPYESVYVIRMKPRQIAVPAVTQRLRAYYSLLGVEATYNPPLTEDHAAVILEFLAALHEALSYARGEVREEVENVRMKFVGEHVERWFPRLARCILENTRDETLTAVARILSLIPECEARI